MAGKKRCCLKCVHHSWIDYPNMNCGDFVCAKDEKHQRVIDVDKDCKNCKDYKEGK